MKSVFDGTWRPDYAAPGPEQEPEVLSLADGVYECHSCHPPYRLPTDGQDHSVENHPRFDTLAITVVDNRTVHKVGRRRGAVVFESTTIVAADGDTTTEQYTAVMKVGDDLVPMTAPLIPRTGVATRPVLFGATARRVGPPTPDAHRLSGSWKVAEIDLVGHEEDTIYRIVNDTLTMADGLGRSFRARLDGTVAPYLGDPRFTGVSVRSLDERTIEESDLSGEIVSQVTRWSVDPDGRTMHVRFDDMAGHVMEQTGHKLPGTG